MSPIARPLASSTGRQVAWTSGGSKPVRTAKDSAPAPSSTRISGRQLDQIASSLTDLDRDVLLLVQSLRVVSGEQLRRRFWPGDETQARAGRRALKRLTNWRVLDRLPRSVGGIRSGSEGFIYVLGPAGNRVLQRLGFQGCRTGLPGDRYINHCLSIADVVVGLHEAAETGALEVIEVQTEPRCWRGFIGFMGARVLNKPDLFLRLGAGSAEEDRWFVEVDLATEARGTLEAKLRRYAQHLRSGEEQRRHSVFPRVIWAVPNIKRAGQLNDLIEAHGDDAKRLHVVTTHDALIPVLTSEARR